MINEARDIALIDELRALPAETSWVEFKGNNTDPKMIGKRCSALSNSACIEGRDYAYMLWGIEDGSHEVIGTTFNPDSQNVNGQVLQFWLANYFHAVLKFLSGDKMKKTPRFVPVWVLIRRMPPKPPVSSITL